MPQRWAVTASAESLGGTGSCGHEIVGDGYSELSTNPAGPWDFRALGNLPCGYTLAINNPANGRTVYTRKQDVGAGSAFLPVMGLYPSTVQKLGLTGGKFAVIISAADDSILHPVRGQPVGDVRPAPTESALSEGDLPESDYEVASVIRDAAYVMSFHGENAQDQAQTIARLVGDTRYCNDLGRVS